MSGFYSLPMTSGPNDFQVGEDELGNPVFLTPAGQRYTVKQQPANKGSYAKAALETLNEARKAPLESLGAVAKGIAQGVWSGVSAPGRAAAGEPVTYGDAAELAGMVSLPALAGRYDPAVANMGIRAYHGSPHDFDRFSMDKIGTGEGAQAYGHGLYFAEAEDVANMYKRKLAYPRIDNPQNATERAIDDINYFDGNEDAAIEAWRADIANYPDSPAGKSASEKLAAWESGDVKRRGHMYEVNINADPADFLDWDAPLSEQPQKVRDAFAPRIDQLKQAGARFSEDPTGDMLWRSAQDQGGVDVLDMTINPASTGARRLREAGIPGIKYKDGMSRGTDGGTRNYVVFDENLIDIVRKYGLAGIATAGALNAEKDQIRAYLDRAPGT